MKSVRLGGLLAAQKTPSYNGCRCDSVFVSALIAVQCITNNERFSLIDQQLLDILRCPHDHSPLALASEELVTQINRSLEAGRVSNLAGETLARQLDGGLVRQGGDLVYPVIDGIPVLLPDEAIDISQLSEAF